MLLQGSVPAVPAIAQGSRLTATVMMIAIDLVTAAKTLTRHAKEVLYYIMRYRDNYYSIPV